uniref:Rif1_N domain-containing protein n=1 Tax=Anopheles maculatus TaxID=74869 RepID=A0A182SHZ0_9DIPT
MSARQRLLPGCEHYDPLRKALQSGDGSCAEVDGILVELEKACNSVAAVVRANDSKNNIGKYDLKFWIECVGRLMFEAKSTKTKQLALNALEAAVNHIKATNYQEHSLWGEMREIISKEYTSLLDTARSEKDPHWHRMWSVLVRIIDRELCQGSSIINMFLSIVEAGFRSPELSIREQSFDCWRLLVEIFANNKQINIPKRVKLICIPLKSSKSKTETIAMKKFDIWWYLLCQLRPQLDAMADTIFEPFIYFCFGPSFKTPLCYYFDPSYQELGAPGKMYQSIKQLSAIALIHLLGPAPAITKTLVTAPDSGGLQLPFDFPDTGMAISDTLFSAKAKLIVDSCTECTVLLAQMYHLDYLQINRCVWNNLIRRATAGTTVSKIDMLQWIKDDMNALLKLHGDLVLRDLLYDTLLTIVQSDLLKVNIGYDSPEQLMFNYKTLMALLLHPQLPCPVEKSEPIVKSLFDLKRHTGKNGHWDILHKTIQYICHEDEHTGNNSSDYRAIRAQIYTQLGNYLTVQMRDDMEGFLQHQTAVMSFLLYPLEYDQLLLIDSVKGLWMAIYEPIAKQETNTCEFVNAFCEMIKAMTIAKHGYSTAVVADSLCYIMQSLPENFAPTSSPVRVLELFKDVSRKGLAYKSNLDRIELMVGCFAELLERLSPRNVLVLILPIRNAINELVSSEHGLQMGEVKRMLKVISSKMILPEMSKELDVQSSDVKWNCKMLLTSLLNLSDDVKKGWKVTEMKKLMNSWDNNKTPGNNKTPKRNTKGEEFVVIEKVWKFKPESLTEHQREKMMEKRTDIPALYNDMSQSQDSFVIKPWTPSKGVMPLKQNASSAEVTVPDSATSQTEADSIPSKEAGKSAAIETEPSLSASNKSASESKPDTNRLDKENNNGNVLNEESSLTTKQQQDQTESEEEERKQQNRKRMQSILDSLRIDTVEGKSLDVMNLSRTRRSELPDKRSTRQKMNSSQTVDSEKKRNSLSRTKMEQKSASTSKVPTPQDSQLKKRRRSRKLLNFEKHESTVSSSERPRQSQADVSDDVIESSQSDSSESTNNRRPSFVKSSAPELPAKSNDVSDACTTETQQENVENITVDETPNVDKMDVEYATNSAINKVSDIEAHVEKESDTPLVPEQPSKAEPKVVQQPAAVSTANEVSTSSAQSAQAPPKSSTILLSPSRRSARLSLDDSNKIVLNQILSPRKLADNKLVAKCLYSPSKSMLKAEKKGKESPSTKTSVACDEAMREALKFGGVANGDTNAKEESVLVENCSGLSSPKVACFRPLVVVEALTNIAKTLQDDAEHRTEAVSHPISSLTMDSKEHDENYAGDSGTTLQPTTSDKPTESVVASVEDKTKQPTVQSIPTSEQACSGDPSVLCMDQLSPVKNLDEEMEPLNKSLNRSIVSSPDRAGEEERNADLLNSTVNISPIAEEKGSAAKSVDTGELAGSADSRRSSNRIVSKERDMSANATSATPVQTVVSRRSKASPTPHTPSNSALKASRTHLQSSSGLHSPRSQSMIGLGGRGAQLINLIRNQQQSDQSPKPNTPPQNASTPKVGQGSSNRLMMRKKAIFGSASTASATEGGTAGCSETMKQGEENGQDRKGTQYLFFSKALPSPLASPAGSILKRKHNQDESGGGDDIESPINKRKRVSFHDPPVSLTKEYIRQVEECRPVSVSRSLQLSSSITSSADRAKFMMRRKSKSDSISELQHFTINQAHSSKEGGEPADAQGDSKAIDEDMEEEVELTSSPEELDEHELMMHDATDNMTALQVTSDCTISSQSEPSNSGNREYETALEPEQQQAAATATVVDEKAHGSPNKVSFSSEEAVLEHVLNRYTLDDIFERYLSAGKTLEKAKNVRTLTKELSTKMVDDSKIRDIVLDELSERHSVEFLDHAIQENSNAKVCERLSAITMMDHVFKQLRATYSVQRPSVAETTQTEQEEAIRVMETIFENMLSLPGTELDGQKLAELREQFLRQELARKNRLEIMSLLETYFKASHTM